MVLSEVEEIITTMELDEETFEEIYKVSWRERSHSYKAINPLLSLAPQSDHQTKCPYVVCERRWCDPYLTSAARNDVTYTNSLLCIMLDNSHFIVLLHILTVWITIFISQSKLLHVCTKIIKCLWSYFPWTTFPSLMTHRMTWSWQPSW